MKGNPHFHVARFTRIRFNMLGPKEGTTKLSLVQYLERTVPGRSSKKIAVGTHCEQTQTEKIAVLRNGTAARDFADRRRPL